MTEADEQLYRELLSDHAAHPRNSGPITDATATAQGHNPTCGDRLTLWIRLDGPVIRDVAAKASGCSISTSSASLMTDAIKGRTVAEAEKIFEQFHAMLTSPLETDIDPEPLGKLAAFGGVRRFPIRVKCATLPWHTMKRALAEKPPGAIETHGHE